MSDKEAFSGMRILYASEYAGANLELSSPNTVQNIFCEKQILAYSDDIFNQMKQGKRAQLMFVQRVILDTNLISDLPKFFTGHQLTTRCDIDKTLKFIANELNGSFDFTFPILENIREQLKDNNPWPTLKVAAALYYKYSYNSSCSYYENQQSNALFNNQLEGSKNIWNEFLNNTETWKFIKRRDLLHVVMLKTYLTCWQSSNYTIESALNKVASFIIEEFDVFPSKELYFSWKCIIGFTVQFYTSVFNEPKLKTPKAKSVNRIKALSWDLFIFRFCETYMSELDGNMFNIPYVTSLDKGLIETIASCPLKALIMNKAEGYVETIFADELQFQHTLNMALTSANKKLLSDPNREIKRDAICDKKLQSTINKLETEINNIAK